MPEVPTPLELTQLPIRMLGRVVDWAVILIGGLVVVLVFLNISLHVIHVDLAWVTEFVELLMVWVTFLGGACAAQRGAHMTITSFVDKLNQQRRRWADLAIQGLCLAILLVLVRYGWALVSKNWGNKLTILEWPVAIQYMGMAVGCALMAVFVASDLWLTLRGVPPEHRYAAATHGT